MSDHGVPTPAALRPPVPTPTSIMASAVTPTSAVPTSAPVVAAASDPSKFGRVEADGTVILHAPEGDVIVGQWAAGEPSAGLAFFGRKYDDLVVEIDLIDKRLADHRAPAEQAETVLARVREALAARSFVGDIPALEARCDHLAAALETAKAAAKARRAEQREAALATRRALADEAEALTESTAWRATTERYAAMVEEWKILARGDRSAEQELWQRVSAARTAFDKRRRQHFTELDAERKIAVGRKRELIAAAESLGATTDWAKTSKQLRDLMGDWKAAPRASRAEEDRLWKRFKAAQDSFYAARTATEDAEQEVLRANVPAKEALAAEAEALLPITDMRTAKSALRSIQDRWEKVGDLPRGDRERIEGRLRKVEESLRKAEADAWKHNNPEAKARAETTANAFTDAVERLEQQRAAAAASGNTTKVADLDDSIANMKALLAAARNAATDTSTR